MTPLTLRPRIRATLDWLAILSFFTIPTCLVWLFLPMNDDMQPTFLNCFIIGAAVVAPFVGLQWFTDWKHRASARLEERRRGVGRG